MKTEKKRSFKGAVLITVVSVMSLLIVFLTSTLVLATAANNRAHKSYSSSQANYTARTAIDSILKAAVEDENFGNAIASLTSGSGFDVDITMESTSAGMGRITKARVEYAGSRDYYDSAEKEWVSKDLISITADVLYGGETKTVTAYVLKNPPTSVSNPGGGGGFVTVGSAVVSNHTNSFGGTYLGIGLGSGSRVYQQNNPALPAPYDDVSLEQKLYLNVKDGVSYSYDADGKPFYSPESDLSDGNADNDIMVNYYTGNDHTIEAPFIINGSLIVNTQTEVLFPTKGSGMAVWGNMDVQNSSFKVSSDTVNNNAAVLFNQEIKKFQDIPYIYVDSLLKLNNQTIGNDELPLNIFCGSINAQQNGVNLYANVYCQDSEKTSVIGNTNTALHAWSTSVLNHTDSYLASQTSGNFYTKGSLDVTGNGASIAGNLVVEGDLTLKGNLTVDGSVVVKGTLISESGSMTAINGIYANSAMGNNISVNLGNKKMASNGVDELYEEQVNTYHAVLAKNVKIAENPYYIPSFNYAWLKKEAIATYGMTDSDGDGIIDGNFYDFSGSEIDTSLVLEKMDNVGDENADTKDYDETVWVNRDDPTDITYNENDTYEASGFKYGDAVIGSPDLYAATHNNQLFPREAEKSVILGFEEIGDGTPIDVSKVVKTVDEIEQSYNFDSDATVTEIPVNGGIRSDVESTVYHSYDVPDEITQSCTLSGSGFNKTIYIRNTSSNNIWVKLQNFNMEAKDFDDYGIIYDDSAPNCGNLILFIEGDATLNKGRIMTKSYYDLIRSGDPLQIATNDDLFVSGVTKVSNPKIKIYSEKATYDVSSGNVVSQPSLTLTNNSIVTAMIEAPYLAFDLKTAATVSNQTFYNGAEINGRPGSADNVGVIGVLNVAKAEGQNNWTFLYTPDSTIGGGGGGGGGAGGNDFIITYYEGF